MTKNTMTSQEKSEYVEVINEPLHIELYQNEYIRLYNASLSPGADTMFHRHSEDTIYIVHEGGEISTEIFPGSEKSPTSFPRSFTLYKKILMGIRLVATGSIKLPRSLFFCILSKNKPTIHRAIASQKNSHSMELMGVEILKKSDHHNEFSLNSNKYRKEYENDLFSVFKFKLQSRESMNQIFNFPGVMIATEGKVEFKNCTQPQNNQEYLFEGSYCWHDINVTRTLVNKGTENFEALIIALK